ncbi:hypothetical protein F1988_03220 [Alistipes indistinctus]|nr:hypothetical protein F1988_03220 [Alistipes indistinctus]
MSVRFAGFMSVPVSGMYSADNSGYIEKLNRMTTKLIRYAWPLMLVLALSCSKKTVLPPSPPDEVPVTIRTLAGAGDDEQLLNASEAVVKSVRVYIFDGNKLDRMQFFGEDAIAKGMRMQAKVKGHKTFCAVVNEPAALTGTLENVTTPAGLQAVLFSLADYMDLNRSVSTLDQPGTAGAYMLPLYGESNEVTITEDGPNDVAFDIYRAVARVDLYLRTEASAYVNCDVTPSSTLTAERGADMGCFVPDGEVTPPLGAVRTITRTSPLRLSPATDVTDKSDYKLVYSYYLPAQRFARAEDRIRMTLTELDWEGDTASYPSFSLGDGVVGYDNTIRRNSIYKLYCTLSQITFRVDATLHVEDWDVIHQHSGI